VIREAVGEFSIEIKTKHTAKTALKLRRFSNATYEVCRTFLRKTQVKSLTELGTGGYIVTPLPRHGETTGPENVRGWPETQISKRDNDEQHLLTNDSTTSPLETQCRLATRFRRPPCAHCPAPRRDRITPKDFGAAPANPTRISLAMRRDCKRHGRCQVSRACCPKGVRCCSRASVKRGISVF